MDLPAVKQIRDLRLRQGSRIHTADAGLLTDPTELWACAPACRTNR